MVGYPTEKDLKMVCSGMIPKFPVTLYGINNANTIFGPAVPSQKMVMWQPNPVVSNYIKISKEIL